MKKTYISPQQCASNLALIGTLAAKRAYYRFRLAARLADPQLAIAHAYAAQADVKVAQAYANLLIEKATGAQSITVEGKLP